MIPQRQAWDHLARMQQMVAQQPALARAVSHMTLYDQLDLTLELLHMHGHTHLDEYSAEPWPSNVIRFRTRPGSLTPTEARPRLSHPSFCTGTGATLALRLASLAWVTNPGSCRLSRPLAARPE